MKRDLIYTSAWKEPAQEIAAEILDSIKNTVKVNAIYDERKGESIVLVGDLLIAIDKLVNHYTTDKIVLPWRD